MNPVEQQTRPDRIMLGITLMIISVFMMSIQEALFKYFSSDLSLWQIFTLRGLLALFILSLLILLKGLRRQVWIEALGKWPLLRSLYMTMMFISMYASIPFLSLSTAAAGMYSAPIFVALMSAYLIREAVGITGWVAIVMGFTGVLVILQPGADAFSLWALCPVLGGFFYALANITTRSKCQRVSLPALSLSLNLTLFSAGVIFSFVTIIILPNSEITHSFPFILGVWAAMGVSEWVLVILLAVLVVIIGMSVAGAYQSAPPTTVATFDYCYLIFMAFWDYLIFDTPPNQNTIIGIVLIITAGILIVRRR